MNTERQENKLLNLHVVFLYIYTYVRVRVMCVCIFTTSIRVSLKYVSTWVSLVGGSFDILDTRFYMPKPEKRINQTHNKPIKSFPSNNNNNCIVIIWRPRVFYSELFLWKGDWRFGLCENTPCSMREAWRVMSD